MANEIDPDIIAESLKEGKSVRMQNSIDKLNTVLSEYYESGERDFSVTTIGKVSQDNGGVGYPSIRATKNKHFRDLIAAWAAKAETTMKKPPVPHAESRREPKDNDLLKQIDDPVLRAWMGQIIAERNRFRNELNILKSQTEFVIDRRPVRQFNNQAPDNPVELLPAFTLTEMEKMALKALFDKELLEENGWEIHQNGKVMSVEYDTEVLPRPFAKVIKKVLGETDE